MGKRGPGCSICASRERASLDLALSRGISMGALARRYGVGPDALSRHKANHLSPQIRARLIAGPDVEGVDLDRLRETESQSLLSHLIALRNRLFAALDFAEEHGDSAMVARVSSQLHRNLELTGELLGDLSTGTSTVTNITIRPEYLVLRVGIVQALAAHPEAKRAVVEVLARLENEAAESIRTEDRSLAR